MNGPSSGLSAAQLRAFEENLERLGVSREGMDAVDTGQANGGLVVGGSGGGAPVRRVTVGSMAELRELLGKRAPVPVEVPPELPAERADALAAAGSAEEAMAMLTPEEHGHLALARRALLHGDADRVASYEPVLDRLAFPAEVAVHAATDITIQAGHPLIFQGPNPVVANYGTVTVEPGGQILCETEVTLTAQTFTAQ